MKELCFPLMICTMMTLKSLKTLTTGYGEAQYKKGTLQVKY